MNVNELVSFCDWLGPKLISTQLQDLWTDEKFFVLKLFNRQLSQDFYFVCQIDQQNPIFWIQSSPPPIAKKPKPLSLFLNSNAKNRYLQGITVDYDLGRVVDLTWKDSETEIILRMILIPRAFNLIATQMNTGKKISWFREQALTKAQNPPYEIIKHDWEKFCADHSLFSEKKKDSSRPEAIEKNKSDFLSKLQKDLAKKTKAIQELSKQVDSQESVSLRDQGELLKVQGASGVEIEKIFQKAKQLDKKKLGATERIEILQLEVKKISDLIFQIESGDFDPIQIQKQKNNKSLQRRSQEIGARGRRLQLPDQMRADVGKSAADNLLLLRGAKPWDLWMHLKDRPGAYAIISRNREQKVSIDVLQKVFEWLIKMSGEKLEQGGKASVLLTECRFVKPIKGDKLGRVTHQNSQVYTFASTSKS